MTVWFVGAGPGAADLLTVRAQRLLAAAPVVLYAGSLVPPEVLAGTRPDARLVNTADLDLDAITGELVAADARGDDVVRLHSGDPSIFSAVAEQARRLDAAGVPWEIVPGVPAFAAAAAALRQELTLPGVGQTVVLTRTSARATPMPEGEDLARLGATGCTLVLHLAVQNVDQVAQALLPHYGAACPAAVVARASCAGRGRAALPARRAGRAGPGGGHPAHRDHRGGSGPRAWWLSRQPPLLGGARTGR